MGLINATDVIADMYIAQKEFKQWAVELWQKGFCHGSKLSDSIRRADNVATANQILDRAVARGIIKKIGDPNPTHNQAVFGGLTYGKILYDSAHAYACSYGYEPCQDSSELACMIESARNA